MSVIFKFIFFEFGAVDKLRNDSTYTAKNMLKNIYKVIRCYRKFHKEDASGRTQSTCK